MQWQEALERKGLKVITKKTEVVLFTREVRLEADISDKKKDRLKQVNTYESWCYKCFVYAPWVEVTTYEVANTLICILYLILYCIELYCTPTNDNRNTIKRGPHLPDIAL